MSELALIEKVNEGNFLGNYAKWPIHTLFIHYITKGRHQLSWPYRVLQNNSKFKI